MPQRKLGHFCSRLPEYNLSVTRIRISGFMECKFCGQICQKADRQKKRLISASGDIAVAEVAEFVQTVTMLKLPKCCNQMVT